MVFPFADVLRAALDWMGRKIGRRHHRAEIEGAIATELHELRFVLAGVLVLVHSKLHTMNQAVLDLIRPAILNYRGDRADQGYVDATKTLLAKGDAAYIAFHNARPTDPTKAYYPVPYGAPVLAAHMGELAIFPSAVRTWLVRVSRELELYNSQVALVQASHNRTFDSSLSAVNRAANEQNLIAGTEKMGTRAAALIEAINQVVDSTGVTRR